MTRTMLAVFAHPDDESFGPGGTLAKYAAGGVEITLVVFTRGEKSTIGHSLEQGTQDLGSLREEELCCAARELGLKEVRVLNYPDTGLQDVDPHELIRVVGAALKELRPEIVLTFDPEGITGNPDHIAVSRAVTEAVRVYSESESRPGSPQTRLFYWVLPEHIAAHLRRISDIPFVGTSESKITTIIDIADFKDQQWRAITCHRTQSDPVPRVLRERLEAQAGTEYFVRFGPGADTEDTEHWANPRSRALD